MASFPQSEAEVTTLATTMISGLDSDLIFANPPATSAQLQTELADFNDKSGVADVQRAQAQQATTDKTTAFNSMTTDMKNVLAWAVKIPGVTAAQLKKIGWDFPAPPTPLQAPAQCGNFRLHHINGHTLDFDWDKPSYKEGGKPSGFTLYKRESGSSAAWLVHHTIFSSSAHEDNSDFASGSWDVLVRASNAAGEGPESNVVTVTVG